MREGRFGEGHGGTLRLAWIQASVVFALAAIILLSGLTTEARAQALPVPFINAPTVPESAAPGGPAFTLSVNGTGFASGAVVYWGLIPLTTTFVGSSQLNAQVPASYIAVVNTVPITVRNPASSASVRRSNSFPFEVTTASSDVTFANAPGSPLAGFSQPKSVAAADFNNDGIVDLAIANAGNGTVTLLLGKGDGTFAQAPGAPISVGSSPQWIVAGRFDNNSNSYTDLAVLNSSSNNVTILLGNGDGTFTQASGSPITVGSGPVSATVGDFNGDGTLDLAIANASGSPSLSILLGNGDGTFTQATGSPIALTTPANALAIGDFDSDGKLDLALADGSSTTVTILKGDGAGGFTVLGSPITVGSNPKAILAGDFNGDGKLDLAVANLGSASVSVLLGKGDGTFTPASGSPITVGASPAGLVAGDFNGDNTLDLAVTNSLNSNMSILLGSGSGTFAAASSSPATGGFPSSISLFAIRTQGEQGRLGLVTANGAGNTVSVFLQPGAVATVSQSSLVFGDQITGTASAAQSVNITSAGTAPFYISSVSAPSPFAETNSCGIASLPSGCATFTAGLIPNVFPLYITAPAFDSSLNATVQMFVGVPTPGTSPGTSLPLPASTGQIFCGLVPLTDTISAQAYVPTSSERGGDYSSFSGQLIDPTTGLPIGNNTVLPSSLSPGEIVAWPIAPSSYSNFSTSACTVNVTFDPTTLGTASGSLTIADNSAGSPQTVALSGQGVSAALASLSVTSLTYGNQEVSVASAPQTVTLTNTGAGPLGIMSIASNNNDYAETNTCPASLAVNASCTFTVTFKPSSLGADSGEVIITDDAAGSPQAVGLSGTGVPPVYVNPSSLSFANQPVNTSSSIKALTLTNYQNVTLNISNIAASNGFSDVATCSATLAPGATCTISVFFLPTTAGNITGTLTVTDDAPDSPQTANLSGAGVSGSVITFSNTEYDFPYGSNEGAGKQPVGTTSTPVSIPIANTGSQALAISSIAATGDYAQTNNCPVSPATLAPGATCTISVTFTPTVTGTDNGTLTVSGNAVNSPQTLALAGIGVTSGPVATIPLGSNGYLGWKQPVNSTPIPEIVPLTNTGNQALNISSISVPAPFSETNNCPASLAPGASCDITVSVSTTALCEDDYQNLTIATTNGGTVTLALEAYGADSGLNVVDLNSQTVQSLVNSLVGTGVTVSNIKYTGAPIAAATFSGGANIFGFDTGVILSNGSATNVIGPNCSDGITGDNNLPGDPLLTALIGGQETNDAASLEFDFVPVTNTLTFQYVIASDEYNEFVYQFNDVFGLFVNGSNVALVPGTTLPVSINDVNDGNPVGTNATNPQYYTNNEFFYPNSSPLDTEMDGVTKVFTAKVGVSPGVTNHIKFAVADALDHVLDTNVMIEGASLNSSSVEFSPSTLSFGSVNVGTTSPLQTVTFTNTGSSPVTISNIQVSGDFAQTNDCPASPNAIAPNGSCTLTVTFAPTAQGARTGALTVTDSAPGSPQSVSLSGTGVAAGQASLSATSITLPSTPLNLTCHPVAVTLTNTGAGALNISSISTSNQFTQINTCPASLAAGASCTISVTFHPAAIGLRTGTLSITDDAPGSPQTVALSGNGEAACNVVVAATATTTVIRGTDAANFTLSHQLCAGALAENAVNFSCQNQQSALCAFNPTVVPPSSNSSLTISNLHTVGGDALDFNVLSNLADGSNYGNLALIIFFSDYTLTPLQTAETIHAGQSAQFAMLVAPVNGLSGTVSLSCSGAPAGSTCTVSPSTATLAGSTAMAKINITTTARSGTGPLAGPGTLLPPSANLRWIWLWGLLIVLAAGSFTIRCRRRWVGLAITLATVLVWAACGGGGMSPSGGPSGTPAGVYDLTIQGTYTAPNAQATAVNHTARITLTVN